MSPAARPHQAHAPAVANGTGGHNVRRAVAALVAQERAGARPRLTGNQVAVLVGVKERRAQVLLRELRTNDGLAASENGHRPMKGGK